MSKADACFFGRCYGLQVIIVLLQETIPCRKKCQRESSVTQCSAVRGGIAAPVSDVACIPQTRLLELFPTVKFPTKSADLGLPLQFPNSALPASH